MKILDYRQQGGEITIEVEYINGKREWLLPLDFYRLLKKETEKKHIFIAKEDQNG